MKRNLIYLLLMFNVILYFMIFLSPLKTSKYNFLTGIYFSVMLVLIFLLGVVSVRSRKNIAYMLESRPRGNIFYLMLCFLAFIFSLTSINFYTGNSVDFVFLNIFLGYSNYNDYQKFFEQNILGLPIQVKLLGIFSQAITKFICLYISFKYFLFENSKNKLKLFAVIGAFSSHILFALARGTFFEIFEISIISMFLIFVKTKGIRKMFLSRRLILLAGAIAIVLMIYQLNLNLRYGEAEVDLCITQLICYDESFPAPAIGKLLTKLMGYFGFPVLYLSKFLEEYMLYSPGNFVALISPFPMMTADLSPRFLCDASLDCGASWSPFVEKIIINFGLMISLVLIFALGSIYSIVFNFKKLLVIHFIFLYYIFLFLISLPVNDFIYSVSSNTIIFTASALFVLKFNFLKNVKFK